MQGSSGKIKIKEIKTERKEGFYIPYREKPSERLRKKEKQEERREEKKEGEEEKGKGKWGSGPDFLKSVSSFHISLFIVSCVSDLSFFFLPIGCFRLY